MAFHRGCCTTLLPEPQPGTWPLPRLAFPRALGNCPTQAMGRMVFPFRIQPVSTECLPGSGKVFATGMSKGRQRYASCFALLVERPTCRLGE